jgi:hypothetical protein
MRFGWLFRLARRLQSQPPTDGQSDTRRLVMGKYVLAWLLGVPASVLALIYIVSNAGCS